jgi:Protein of unknown function (DUF3800)
MVNQKVAARLQVGPNCLLFFIDETGHETFADKNYPVFGLGGCAIDSSSAAAVIAEPWRAMKAAHFGGEDVPLHANELRNPTTEQLDALSKFFREQQFARLAVTMSYGAPGDQSQFREDAFTRRGAIANETVSSRRRQLHYVSILRLLNEGFLTQS